MYSNNYSIFCGITYDRVVDLIPYFDILDIDFIHYMAEYWLKDKELSCPSFNEEVFLSCKKFFYTIEFPDLVINNGNFMAFSIDWKEKIVHFIVLGYVKDNKYYDVLKLFRTREDELEFNKVKQYYENV